MHPCCALGDPPPDSATQKQAGSHLCLSFLSHIRFNRGMSHVQALQEGWKAWLKGAGVGTGPAVMQEAVCMTSNIQSVNNVSKLTWPE